MLHDNALRARIANEAYDRLAANSGQDWAVVRETGRNWAEFTVPAVADSWEDGPVGDGPDERPPTA